MNEQNSANTDDIHQLESEIETIYTEKVRARIQSYDERKTKLKYFLNLERSRQTRKTITSLKVGDRKITSISEILNEEVTFFKNLYSSNNSYIHEINSYLSKVNVQNILNNNPANLCKRPLSAEKFRHAVIEIKSNRSPWNDGLTVDLFNKCRSKLENIVVESLTYVIIKDSYQVYKNIV